MLKLTIMEKQSFQDRQDLVHRDVKKITSAVYESPQLLLLTATELCRVVLDMWVM